MCLPKNFVSPKRNTVPQIKFLSVLQRFIFKRCYKAIESHWKRAAVHCFAIAWPLLLGLLHGLQNPEGAKANHFWECVGWSVVGNHDNVFLTIKLSKPLGKSLSLVCCANNLMDAALRSLESQRDTNMMGKEVMHLVTFSMLPWATWVFCQYLMGIWFYAVMLTSKAEIVKQHFGLVWVVPTLTDQPSSSLYQSCLGCYLTGLL